MTRNYRTRTWQYGNSLREPMSDVVSSSFENETSKSAAHGWFGARLSALVPPLSPSWQCFDRATRLLTGALSPHSHLGPCLFSTLARLRSPARRRALLSSTFSTLRHTMLLQKAMIPRLPSAARACLMSSGRTRAFEVGQGGRLVIDMAGEAAVVKVTTQWIDSCNVTASRLPASADVSDFERLGASAVSYTHLTLPTILLV